MNELLEHLHSIVSTTSYPISFSGDISTVINRWLVKAQYADHYEANNTEPFLRPEGRIIARQELSFLSDEERESNYTLFCSTDWDRYLCQYCSIQKNFKLDKDKYIYGLAIVYCREEHESMIYCTSMAPFSLWINGQYVYGSNYDFLVKESTFVYNFKKGINIVLVEKPYFMRHESLRLNPDDFNITIKPYDFCADPKNNYFFDISMFEKLKNRYRILLNKAVYEENDKVEALILPRYFKADHKDEAVTISVYDDNDKLITSVDTMTTTRVTLDIDPSYRGILKISASLRDKASDIIDNYIVIGDLMEFANRTFEIARTRKDCNESILYSINQLVTIPNTKVGIIHDFYDMMNTYIYHILLEKLYELRRFLTKPELDHMAKPFDIYQYCATLFYKNNIDDNYTAAYIVLPKNYDKNKKYPAVVHIEYGYGMSQYPILREYHRYQDFEDAILVDICGRGGLNKDFIDESRGFDVLQQIVDEYNIDRDRIYEVGSCTGSMKGYGLAMRNPSLFAAIYGVNGTIRTNLNNPDFEQLRNLETIPINHMYCVEDWDFNCSTIEETFSHVKNAVLWSVVSYSHIDFNESLNSNRIVEEVLKYKRNRYPRELHYTIYEPIYNHCHWVLVDRMADLSKKSIIDAKLVNEAKIEIKEDNIATLSLLLDKDGMELNDDVTIVVDGNEYHISINDYTRVVLHCSQDGVEVEQEKLSEDAYNKLIDAIAIDQALMGIKELYYSKCKIVLSNAFPEKKSALVKRLLRALSLPLVERAKNYQYEKLAENDVDEKVLAQSNFVYFTNLDGTSQLQQDIMTSANCEVTGDKLSYNGTTYHGDTFAIIKCKNPYNPQYNTLLVVYNNESVLQELLNVWGTFDDNARFYGEAIIYNNEQYYCLQ